MLNPPNEAVTTSHSGVPHNEKRKLVPVGIARPLERNLRDKPDLGPLPVCSATVLEDTNLPLKLAVYGTRPERRPSRRRL